MKGVLMDKNIDDEMVVIDNSDWGDCDSEVSDRLHTVETNINALDSTVDRLRGKVNGLKQRVGTMSWCVIALSVVLLVDSGWDLLSAAMGW